MDYINGTNTSSITAVVLVDTASSGSYSAGTAWIQEFDIIYKHYHGYVAAVMCVCGILANIVNVIVLTQRSMRSATNCLLTGLAISDSLTIIAYFPFALQFYVLHGTEQTRHRNSLASARFLYFYAIFSVVVHTVSIWLTVTLAIFRYITVTWPHLRKQHCSIYRAKMSIVFVWIATVLVTMVPNLLVISMDEIESQKGVYIVSFKEGDKWKTALSVNFWIQAIAVKIVPCVGLTVLSVLLLRTMKRVQKTRRTMHNVITSGAQPQRERATNRTTAMLLTVVALFLITELPQGIMSLLSGFLEHFRNEIYIPLGDLMDIFVLINNSINFVLYCTMSKDFRKTFTSIFCPRNELFANRRCSLTSANKHYRSASVSAQSKFSKRRLDKSENV